MPLPAVTRRSVLRSVASVSKVHPCLVARDSGSIVVIGSPSGTRAVRRAGQMRYINVPMRPDKNLTMTDLC